MMKVNSEAHKKKKSYITLRQISAGVAAAAVVAISFVALGEVVEMKKTKQSEQFITSQISDEPIQKEAEKDMPADYSFGTESKNTNGAKAEAVKKLESLRKDATEAEEIQTAQQIPVGISLDEETKIYKTVTVTPTEESLDVI